MAAHANNPAIPCAEADISHIELGSRGGITVEAITSDVGSNVEFTEELFIGAMVVPFQRSEVVLSVDMFSLLSKKTISLLNNFH